LPQGRYHALVKNPKIGRSRVVRRPAEPPQRTVKKTAQPLLGSSVLPVGPTAKNDV
jgi:hypothetical protein